MGEGLSGFGFGNCLDDRDRSRDRLLERHYLKPDMMHGFQFGSFRQIWGPICDMMDHTTLGRHYVPLIFKDPHLGVETVLVPAPGHDLGVLVVVAAK